MGETKPCQQLAVVTIANCSICHGGGERKLFQVQQSKCQTWFYHRLSDYSDAPQQRPTCLSPDSLSGTRFRILTRFFHSKISVRLLYPTCGLILCFSASNKSDHICICKQAVRASIPRLGLMCALTVSYLKTVKSYKANLSLLERAQHFIPPSVT